MYKNICVGFVIIIRQLPSLRGRSYQSYPTDIQILYCRRLLDSFLIDISISQLPTIHLLGNTGASSARASGGMGRGGTGCTGAVGGVSRSAACRAGAEGTVSGGTACRAAAIVSVRRHFEAGGTACGTSCNFAGRARRGTRRT